MPVRHIFRHEAYLGSTREGLNSYSAAFFCPHCGDVWGRIVVEGKAVPWLVIVRACEGEPSLLDQRQDVPGSFFNSYLWWGNRETMRGMLRENPALLRHEFEVHLKDAERRGA